jgi:hypothetical protein
VLPAPYKGVVQDAVVTELTDAVERGWSAAAGTDDALYLMGADGTVTRMSLGG